MRWKNPQGIEPYLRDLRVHLLYIWGFRTVRKIPLPLEAAPAARKDREAAVFFFFFS